MAADGKLVIETFLDKSGLNKAFKELGDGSAAEAAQKALQGITKTILAVSTALVGLAATAIKVGADFEAAMSEVAALSGATGDDLAALTEKAKEMGIKTKFSATEAAEAMNYMAQAGWDTQDMLDGLEGVISLAAASGEDLATTSGIVTDSLTAFGLQASDTAHFADVLSVAANASNTDVAMMGETFKYAASVAGALGFSIEDVSVAAGLMANSGIKAEQAGTSLRALFTRLTAPTTETAEAMKSLGLEITNSDGSMRSLSDIIAQMREGFSGLSESEKASTASAIAGTEAMSGLLAIVNASDEDFASLTDSINNASGAAESMASVMQDNLEGDITILKSSLEGLGIQVYESFQEPLREAAQAAIDAVNEITAAFASGKMKETLDKLAETLAKLAEDLVKFVLDILPGLIDAFSWLIDNLPFVISLWGGLTAALNLYITVQKLAAADVVLFGVAMQSLTPIIGWVSVAIAGVSAALGLLVTGLVNTTDPMEEVKTKTEEIAAANDELNKSIDDAEAARADSLKTIVAESNTLKKLDSEIRDLAKNEGRSTVETEKMYQLIDQLNEAVPDLNQAYDEQTGALKENVSAVYDKIDAQIALAKQEAAQEQLVEVAKELIDIDSQRAENSANMEQALADQAAAQERLNTAQAAWNEHAAASGAVLVPYTLELNAAKDAMAACTSQVDTLTTKQATLDTQEADLNAESERLVGIMGDATDATKDTTDATDALATAYADAYTEAEDSLSKQVDLFRGVKDAAKTSVDEIIQSMLDEQEAWTNYGSNIQAAMDMHLDTGLIQQLSDGSTESMLILNEIVKNGKDKVAEINAAYSYVSVGTNAYKDAVGDLGNTIAQESANAVSETKSMVTETGNELKNLKPTFGEAASDGVKAYTVDFGVDEGVEPAKRLVSETATALEDMKPVFGTASDNAIQAYAVDFGVDDCVTPAEQVVSGTTDTLSDLPTAFSDAAKDATTGYTDNADTDACVDCAETVVAESTAALSDLPTAYKDAADDAIDGFVGQFRARIAEVVTVAANLGNAAAKALRDSLQEHSPSKVFAKIGRYAVLGFVNGLSSAESEVIDAVENIGDAIQTATKDVIDKHFEYTVMAAGDEIERIYDRIEEIENTEITKKNKAALEAEKDALERRKEVLEDLKDAYQDAYNDILDSQNTLENKLKSFGDLIETIQVGDNDVLQLTNLQPQIDQLKKYGSQLEALKAKGAPAELLSEIISDMDVDEGSTYMAFLLGKSDTDFATYIGQWQEKQDLAADIAETFYSDQLTALKEKFTDKVTEQLSATTDAAYDAGKAAAEAYVLGFGSVDTSALTVAVASETGTLTGTVAAKSGTANVTSSTTNNSAQYSQIVNINQPVASPAETARAVQRASEDMING